MNTESAQTLNVRLRQRYADVVDLPLLQGLAGQRDLSGLFVPAVSDGYLRSRVRVMIVGRETAGWGKLRADLTSPERSASIDAYLAHQMERHQRKVVEVRATSKFFQFYRETARKVAAPEDRMSRNVPVWANLFCFDEDETRPDGSRGNSTAEIVQLSGALLRVQLEVLRPEWIVFTTGSSCDRYLKSHFGDLAASRVHIRKRIWEFRAAIPNDSGEATQVVAFRTPHPRHAPSRSARAAIVDEALRPGALAAYLSVVGHCDDTGHA